MSCLSSRDLWNYLSKKAKDMQRMNSPTEDPEMCWHTSQEASNRLTDPGCVLLDGKCDCPRTKRDIKCKKNYDEF